MVGAAITFCRHRSPKPATWRSWTRPITRPLRPRCLQSVPGEKMTWMRGLLSSAHA